VVATLLLAVAGAAAQRLKIGFVNTDRIEAESVLATRADAAMKAEFAPRERQIVELQKRIKADQDRYEQGKATMPPAELKILGESIAKRMRESDQLVYAMSADINLRRKGLSAKLVAETTATIKAIAEEGKYDLVVNNAIYAGSAIDLTDRVLKELARRAGK